MTFIQKYHVYFFIFAAVTLSVFTGFFSSSIAKIYYENNYFSPDPSGNLIRNIELHHALKHNTKWNVALCEFKENRTNPLATIPVTSQYP